MSRKWNSPSFMVQSLPIIHSFPLQQWFSKCGPQTSSVSTTWKLVSLPQSYWIRNSGGDESQSTKHVSYLLNLVSTVTNHGNSVCPWYAEMKIAVNRYGAPPQNSRLQSNDEKASDKSHILPSTWQLFLKIIKVIKNKKNGYSQEEPVRHKS